MIFGRPGLSSAASTACQHAGSACRALPSRCRRAGTPPRQPRAGLHPHVAHPPGPDQAQIRTIVEAFAPSVAEVNEAIAILLAAQAAHWVPIRHAQRGQGPATGRLKRKTV